MNDTKFELYDEMMFWRAAYNTRPNIYLYFTLTFKHFYIRKPKSEQHTTFPYPNLTFTIPN